jgi:hypothetical protein
MVNQGKKNDPRFWKKWEEAGAVGTDKTGRAYAFFNCRASKQEIEAEIPTIRELVQTPGELELSLTDNFKLKDFTDYKLRSIVKYAKKSGMNYLLTAKYPNATNKQTGDEVAGVLNQAYQSPLYQEGEQFSGAIVYKEMEDYIFRE